MKFSELPIGAMFKFFEGGSLLTKTGARSYAAPQWGHADLQTDPGTGVIPKP
jgi:hypothetical protein